jgi:hypothetical protein
MKTIAQFIAGGITTLADLRGALQTAMQLEFATIPPYLCAEWSINSDNDPGGVLDMIQSIAAEEMFHFALAGNMLSAIGGKPSIANAGFVPSYPTRVLPGGIPQKLPVDLLPLSANQLQVFMQIEFPEFPPVALQAGAAAPTTIGAFYETIAAGFAAVNPTIVADANFVNMGEAVQIKTIADAQAAILRIKGEGEGTYGSPDQPQPDDTKFAHYYVFKEILTGKTLVQTNGQWAFTGAAIPFPAVFNFTQSNTQPDPSLAVNQALSQLLIDLQTCWTSGTQPNIGAMFGLASLGQGLIQQGIRPEFLWSPPSPQLRAAAGGRPGTAPKA